METTHTPISIGEAKRVHLLNTFGVEDAVQKSITLNDFNEKYGEGHDVFSTADVESFEVEARKADGNTDEVSKAIESEFATLSPVIVKGVDEKLTLVYVRESKAPEATAEAGEESGAEA